MKKGSDSARHSFRAHGAPWAEQRAGPKKGLSRFWISVAPSLRLGCSSVHPFVKTRLKSQSSMTSMKQSQAPRGESVFFVCTPMVLSELPLDMLS